MLNLTQAIQNVSPNAKPTNIAYVSRKLPDTIEEARKKVVDKLNLNIEFINKGANAATSKKPDLVYKHDARTDTYSIGAKYGNRWIDCLAGTGEKYYYGIAKAELVTVLKLVCTHIEDGDADDGILAIQNKNLAARRAA